MNKTETGYLNWERIKTKVMFRLVMARGQEKLLEQAPHIRFLDLAVIFYILDASERDSIVRAFTITNRQLEVWGVSKEILCEEASRNMPRRFPAVIQNVEDILAQFGIGPVKEEKPNISLYVLSNKEHFFGAACILYDEILKGVAEKLQGDLLILPSSIHEVLVIPDTGWQDYEALNAMVRAVNREVVSREEQLSDHIYRYIRREKRLTTDVQRRADCFH